MGLLDNLKKMFKVSDEETDDDYTQEIETVSYGRSKAPTPPKNIGGNNDMAKIHIVEPRVYSEVEQFASLLLEKQGILLNLRRVDAEQARRIIDYMAGIAYAIGGDVQKLSSDIFLCTPSNIELEGMLSEENETQHLDFLDTL